jgi:hypothetical protein
VSQPLLARFERSRRCLGFVTDKQLIVLSQRELVIVSPMGAFFNEAWKKNKKTLICLLALMTAMGEVVLKLLLNLLRIKLQLYKRNVTDIPSAFVRKLFNLKTPYLGS